MILLLLELLLCKTCLQFIGSVPTLSNSCLEFKFKKAVNYYFGKQVKSRAEAWYSELILVIVELLLLGMWNDVEYLKWMSDEDLKELAENRDHKDTPSCPYKIQPENQGRLVWLSGPPGAGKSTTGQLMGRDAGFVYLEADCSMNYLNPFVPTNVENPTIAGFQQKALKVNNYTIQNNQGVLNLGHKHKHRIRGSL